MKKILVISILCFSVVALAGPILTSGTTGQTIITNARAYLNETGSGWVSDDEMLVWLNDGLKDIAVKSRCIETSESITLAANTIEYTPNATPAAVTAVIYNDSSGNKTGLQRTTMQGIRRGYSGGVPEYFYFYAGQIGVYPALSTISGETVDAKIAQLPDAMSTSASVLVIPSIYEKALTLYVVAQAKIKNMQYDTANAIMSLYEAEINRYRIDLSNQENQEPVR